MRRPALLLSMALLPALAGSAAAEIPASSGPGPQVVLVPIPVAFRLPVAIDYYH